MKEAREIKKQVIFDAKEQATLEADKILSSAKEQISNEKMKALTTLKNQVAELAIEMTEKVIKSELADKEKQKQYISSILKKENNR